MLATTPFSLILLILLYFLGCGSCVICFITKVWCKLFRYKDRSTNGDNETIFTHNTQRALVRPTVYILHFFLYIFLSFLYRCLQTDLSPKFVMLWWGVRGGRLTYNFLYPTNYLILFLVFILFGRVLHNMPSKKQHKPQVLQLQFGIHIILT